MHRGQSVLYDDLISAPVIIRATVLWPTFTREPEGGEEPLIGCFDNLCLQGANEISRRRMWWGLLGCMDRKSPRVRSDKAREWHFWASVWPYRSSRPWPSTLSAVSLRYSVSSRHHCSQGSSSLRLLSQRRKHARLESIRLASAASHYLRDFYSINQMICARFNSAGCFLHTPATCKWNSLFVNAPR